MPGPIELSLRPPTLAKESLANIAHMKTGAFLLLRHMPMHTLLRLAPDTGMMSYDMMNDGKGKLSRAVWPLLAAVSQA